MPFFLANELNDWIYIEFTLDLLFWLMRRQFHQFLETTTQVKKYEA